MRIAVYCSSRENIDVCYKESAQKIGECIGSNSASLIYGGVDKGLMKIVATAVKQNGGRVVGVVPVTRQEVRNVHDDEMIISSDLNDRKAKMLRLSDLFIVLPGGYGTLDEFVSTFTSLAFVQNQTKQIILLNQNHLFDATLAQFQTMIDEGMMEKELLQRVKVVTNAYECCSMINQFIQKKRP